MLYIPIALQNTPIKMHQDAVAWSVNQTASFHWSKTNSLSRLIDTITITALPVLTSLRTNLDLRDLLVDHCHWIADKLCDNL